MKIKVIDLLVKIANGEKLPKKIKYNDNIYYLSENRVALHKYQTKRSDTTRKLSLIIDNEYLKLNDYVEIIEEPKKIEKIIWNEKESLAGNLTAVGKQGVLARRTEKLKASLNELINEINNLKEDK